MTAKARTDLRNTTMDEMIRLCRGLHEDEENDIQFEQIVLGTGDALAAMFSSYSDKAAEEVQLLVKKLIDEINDSTDPL